MDDIYGCGEASSMRDCCEGGDMNEIGKLYGYLKWM